MPSISTTVWPAFAPRKKRLIALPAPPLLDIWMPGCLASTSVTVLPCSCSSSFDVITVTSPTISRSACAKRAAVTTVVGSSVISDANAVEMLAASVASTRTCLFDCMEYSGNRARCTVEWKTRPRRGHGVQGRSPGLQVLIAAFPWREPQWRVDDPHLLPLQGQHRVYTCFPFNQR